MLARQSEGTMATENSSALARIEAGQAELKTEHAAMAKVLDSHGEQLRVIADRLGLILEKLYPEATEGPTLQELLAEMVVRLSDQTVLLNRIDRRTESMAASLPADVVRAMKDASDANGHRSANGHARS